MAFSTKLFISSFFLKLNCFFKILTIISFSSSPKLSSTRAASVRIQAIVKVFSSICIELSSFFFIFFFKKRSKHKIYIYSLKFIATFLVYKKDCFYHSD